MPRMGSSSRIARARAGYAITKPAVTSRRVASLAARLARLSTDPAVREVAASDLRQAETAGERLAIAVARARRRRQP